MAFLLTARPTTKLGLVLVAPYLTAGCFVSLDELEEASESSSTGGLDAGGAGGQIVGDGDQPVGGTAADDTGGSSSGGTDATGGTGGQPRVTYGPNLIENGDFSQGTTGWDNGDGGVPPADDGFGCTSQTSKEHNFLGWSGGTNGLTLEPGDYVLEFRMMATDADEVNFKIALTVEPFEPEVFNQTIFDVGTLDNNYSFTFPVGSRQTQMGLLVSAQNKVGQVCVDDVSLRRIEE